MTRRDFIAGGAAVCALGLNGADGQHGGIKVRFLGSGAAGWNKHMEAAGQRRCSSVLLDDKVVIDFIDCGFDKLPAGTAVEALFITHSHGDHYDAKAAVRLGPKRLYVQETWAAAAKKHIADAAAELCLPAPEVIALPFGKKVVECGIAFTGVPSNHSTSRVTDGVLERTSMYLAEKGSTRLLYATDTGGIPGDAARMLGIDLHIGNRDVEANGHFAGNPFVRRPEPLTAIIMEATDGPEDEDMRLFVHSSVQVVSRTVNMLRKTKRYCPPEGQFVYLTHLGVRYRSWPSEKIEAELPAGLKAAYDGLEVVFR